MKMIFEPSDIKAGLRVRYNVNDLYIIVGANFGDSTGEVYTTVSSEYPYVIIDRRNFKTNSEMADYLNGWNARIEK